MRKPAGTAYQDLVALVAKAFDPGANVKSGEWVEGPDGRLDMDVSIRGKLNGKTSLVVIECKDFDLSKTGKVGRPFIDALDSKRYDLGADLVFISSNSGFTEDALNKARRKGIGAISVLSSGDPRVKIIIEKEIYFRKVKLGPLAFTYNGPGASSLKDVVMHDLKYKDAPVDAWLQIRAATIVAKNPNIAQRFTATFNFKSPVEFNFKGQNILLESVAVSLSPETSWYAQKIQLDASLGMYDYLRGRVRLTGGKNQYLIKGINFDTGTQLETTPKIEAIGENLIAGEMDVDLVMINGVTLERGTPIPPLEEIIIPDDLSIEI